MKHAIFFCAVTILAAQALAIPQQINYQGQLTRPDGTPLDTTVAMTFRLWPSPAGGTPAWTETHPAVIVTDGLFQAQLGSLTALPDSFAANRWLGLTVGNNTEMVPREQVVSVAHAYRVGTVDGASGGTIGGVLNVGGDNSNDGEYAMVAGRNNHVRSDYSVIAGGGGDSAADSNSIDAASTDHGTISGGKSNRILGGVSATIGGGQGNSVNGNRSTVSGGIANAASSNNATVGGGSFNIASGPGSTVPGGNDNEATGQQSFAAGRRAKAVHNGAFVWADNTNADISSSWFWGANGANTFSVRCSGGVIFYTSANLDMGVNIQSGGGSWVSFSDSTKKRDIHLADTKGILETVAALPIKNWEYKSEPEGTEHIGPMAQDYWKAFHLGSDSLGIATIDADGVLFAAVQELAKQNDKQQMTNNRQQEEIAELRAMVQTLMAEKQRSSLATKE